jgi:tetratricopeptide (TPR) repeat protein
VYRYLYIVIAAFLLTGCAGPLKQGWYNFTAYYNTFYNAGQYFDEGLKLNERQTPDLNPLQPIRIHKSPSNAGHDQFAEAIERGASILRNHENSKYVNPAIFLIGKSYFYRGEYFSALEKFQELQTVASGRERQEAILWQGRTYLEMESVDEGIRFLEVETGYVEDWDESLHAEINALLAQLYVKQRNWSAASEYLYLASGSLTDREKQARAYFLHGQVLEQQGNQIQALAAYRIAAASRSTFDLEFNALRKQAEMARSTGDFDTALQLYRRLSRDDTYFNHHTQMRYELARTHQVMGNSEHALNLYRSLLHDRFEAPDNVTRAKTYFGIGEIYRDDLGIFAMAAAYFDSAASTRVDPTLITTDFNAAELASSFGEYASIKNRIQRADSLLYLSELTPEELDLFIEELQQQLMAEQQQLADDQLQRTERMAATPPADANEVIEAAERTEHGFLNVRNRAMLTDASLQFQAIWGDRPLTDNWRRRAAVSGSRFDQIVLSDDETVEDELIITDEEGTVVVRPDLSDIPFSDEEKENLKRDRENLEYRLANLFMLSLNMPDSARHYYERVIESGMNPELTPRSLFSLADLELLDNNRQQAEFWAERLIADWPESVYAERISSRLNIPYARTIREQNVPAERRYQAIMASEEYVHPADKAYELRKLAGDAPGEEQSSRILFEAARKYLEAAIHESESPNILSDWIREMEMRDQAAQEFGALQDSARLRLSEDELSEEERRELQAIADSVFAEARLSEQFPLEGAWWDSTRSVLDEIETLYASSSVMPAVRVLRESIRKPDDPPAYTVDRVERFPEELMPRDPAPGIQSCSDAGLRPDAGSGPDQIMQYARYPEWAREAEIKSEITYRITVNPDGTVADYEQVSTMDRTGIPQAVEEAIERFLRFQPFESDSPVTCSITFRIET